MKLSRRSMVGMASATAATAGTFGLSGATAQTSPGRYAQGRIGRRPNVENKFGDFVNRVLVGAYDSSHEHLWPENRFRDLPQSATWLWGSLYAEDDSIYVMTRESPPRASSALLLYASPNRKAIGANIHPAAFKAYRGPMLAEQTNKGLRWRSVDYGFLGESSLVIEVSGKDFKWYEKDILQLEGKMTDKTLQIYEPGAEANDGFCYCSQYMRVRGTILGKKVDGWLGYDSIYFKAGVSYPSSHLAHRGVEPGVNLAWPSFANEYTDGSHEYGYFGAGLGDWQFYIGCDDQGNTRKGYVVNATSELKPNKFPKSMRLKVFDETQGREEMWAWSPVQGTDLLDIPKMFPDLPVYLAAEGTMTRENETRTIKRSLGWPDFYSDERLDIYRGIRGPMTGIG